MQYNCGISLFWIYVDVSVFLDQKKNKIKNKKTSAICI